MSHPPISRMTTYVSRKPKYKDVYRRTIEMSQCTRTFKVNYRPCSEASEGYVFTGVCHFNSGEVGEEWTRDQVTTPPSPPPGTRSQHLPLPLLGPGHNTSLPGLCAGYRYASYWNALLLLFKGS